MLFVLFISEAVSNFTIRIHSPQLFSNKSQICSMHRTNIYYQIKNSGSKLFFLIVHQTCQKTVFPTIIANLIANHHCIICFTKCIYCCSQLRTECLMCSNINSNLTNWYFREFIGHYSMYNSTFWKFFCCKLSRINCCQIKMNRSFFPMHKFQQAIIYCSYRILPVLLRKDRWKLNTFFHYIWKCYASINNLCIIVSYSS